MSLRLRNGYYAALGIAALLLYTQFVSIGLDDFDSFSFAFALDRWHNALREVHAPGFPVYLAAGKLLQVFAGDTRLALTLLSAISGALGLVFTAWIGDGLGHRRAGLLAAVLLAFLPGYWLNSLYALSDMPGLMLMLAAMAFLLHSSQWRGHFIIGCLLTGLALGLRPHNALPIAFAGGYALWQVWQLPQQRISTLLVGFSAGLVGILLWLIPVYQTFNGFDGYIQTLNAHRTHIQTADSLFGGSITLDALKLRLREFIDGWSHLLAGGSLLWLAPVGALLLLGLARIPLRHRFTLFCLLWLTESSVKVFLFASLERPRLYLPALIPLILLVAIGYLTYRWQLLRAGAALLVALLIFRTAPLVFRLNQELAAPVQAVHYIQDSYPITPENTMIVSQGSFMAAQYYLGNYHQLYTPYFNPDVWSQDVTNRQPEYLFVLDGDEIQEPVFEALTTSQDYVSIDDRTFERDRRVFQQHVTVRLQVFIPRADLKPEHLPAPENGQIAAGEPSQGKYFGEGWYRIELMGSVPGRWANQNTIMRAALPAKETEVTFLATPYMGGQEVEIVVNGQSVAQIPLNVVWGEYSFTIPADVIAGHDITTIELRHKLAETPENHYRQLAAGYSIFTFR